MPEPDNYGFPEVCLEVIGVAPVLTPQDRAGRLPASGVNLPASGVNCVPASQLASTPQPPPAVARPGKPQPTFQELLKLEPRLGDLYNMARALHDNKDPVFCATAIWGGFLVGLRPGLRAILESLVGGTSQQGGVLRTYEAWEVAYKTIYLAMPECRGRCWCSRFS
jgi:hypothetical protein